MYLDKKKVTFLDKEIEEDWVRGVVGDMWVEWSVVVRGVGGSAIRPVLE